MPPSGSSRPSRRDRDSEGPSGRESHGGRRGAAAGGLVAFPTETVYGLGADASDPEAVRADLRREGPPGRPPADRPPGSGGRGAPWAAEVPPLPRALADACWPGPLTLLLRAGPTSTTSSPAAAPRSACGCPTSRWRWSCWTFDGGIAAPSANRFGRVSPTTAAHVRADLGDEVDLVLDGGPCTIGVESTIVDVTVDPPGAAAARRRPVEALEACSAPVRHRRWRRRAPGDDGVALRARCAVEVVADRPRPPSPGRPARGRRRTGRGARPRTRRGRLRPRPLRPVAGRR